MGLCCYAVMILCSYDAMYIVVMIISCDAMRLNLLLTLELLLNDYMTLPFLVIKALREEASIY